MARVFIVGAGYIGTHAAELLAERGHFVSTGRRSRPMSRDAFPMDVLRPDTFPVALRDAACVVYAVAANGFSEAQYRNAYVNGLANTIRFVASGAGRKRLIYVSSTGVYAQDDGSLVTERSPTQPRGFSGKVLLEGEALVAEAPFEATSLRFSGVYGPGRDRLVRDTRARSPLSAIARETITNRIHRDDCARAIVHLVEKPTVGPLYIGSDEAPSPLGEIRDWLAARLGVAPAPEFEDEGASAQRGGSKRLSSALLRSEGFSFRYPTYREGFEAILAQGS
jgi:nucleoside-diphosphate-sugar epimerase